MKIVPAVEVRAVEKKLPSGGFLGVRERVVPGGGRGRSRGVGSGWRI
jgi:hypothetical protein